MGCHPLRCLCHPQLRKTKWPPYSICTTHATHSVPHHSTFQTMFAVKVFFFVVLTPYQYRNCETITTSNILRFQIHAALTNSPYHKQICTLGHRRMMMWPHLFDWLMLQICGLYYNIYLFNSHVLLFLGHLFEYFWISCKYKASLDIFLVLALVTQKQGSHLEVSPYGRSLRYS